MKRCHSQGRGGMQHSENGAFLTPPPGYTPARITFCFDLHSNCTQKKSGPQVLFSSKSCGLRCAQSKHTIQADYRVLTLIGLLQTNSIKFSTFHSSSWTNATELKSYSTFSIPNIHFCFEPLALKCRCLYLQHGHFKMTPFFCLERAPAIEKRR